METQLLQACTDGDLSTLKDLITEHGLNPSDVKDPSGLSALHLACKHGHPDITQYLIREQNCNPEAIAPNGHTPLHLACKSGHLHIARCLITDYKCNPHCTDNDGYTPLHAASESGNIDSVKYLITETRCDPEVSDSVGNTPLHYASKSGHLNIVQCLITDYHCDPQKPNSRGSIPLHYACYTPLHSAASNGHLAVVKYLINNLGCNPQIGDSDGLTPLHYACLYGHLEVAVYLITETICNPEYPTLFGLTPLHYACLHGYLPIVRYLVCELGCNSQIADDYGQTPLHLASWKGNLDVVTFLISECNSDPQCSDNNGSTPLHCACEFGHLEVAKYLITECKCSLQHGNINGYTPLHLAAGNGHLALVKYLTSEQSCNTQITEKKGRTPLHLASSGGYMDIVTFLILECSCDPQLSNNNGFTPLHYACVNGHLKIAKYLIKEHKCNPQHGNTSGITPLHLAAFRGHLGLVKYLISECGCNQEIGDKDGYTPLNRAAFCGHLAVVKYLITECGCNPEIGDNDGQTPLHSASLSGHLDITIFLISECNCDPQCSDNNGNTPLHHTCQNGHLELAKYLITQHFCNPDYMNFVCLTPLHYACFHGHLAIVKYLVCELGGSLQIVDQNGETPLHFASGKGHLDIVKFLISECNNNPLSSDNDGLTALHYAASEGHHDIVKFLISDCNCDPQCSTNRGFTPLHCACENGHLEVAKYLIKEHKCSPEHANTNGFAPLHSAARNGHLTVAKYLITELGCNPETGDYDGFTPLHYATLKGHHDIVKFLISDCNCNPQCSTNRGSTLHFACQNGHLEVAKHLIKEHKCNPEHGNAEGYTPLHSAASNGHLAVVKYLITELGCNPHIGDNDGYTPLHYATLNGHHDIVKFLISDCNCDPQCCTNRGFTPLHCACENGHLDVAKYLMKEHNCSPKLANTDGFTPLHSAARNGHLSIVKCLIELNYTVNCKDNDGHTPLHCACASGQFVIVQYLHREKLSDLVHTTLSGDTPLHIACKSNQIEITKFLLSTGECNPLHKNAVGLTPLEVTTSVEIRKLLDCFCKGNYPLESVVKIFILGDSMAGKSSMVQALQSNPDFMSYLIGRFQRVKRVRPLTAGIDSITCNSNEFGNVVIYDFAGQREFLTSHAAFLQNSSSQLAGIFIIVTNIARSESGICQSLQYWVSFVVECCAHSEITPHIIIVGSHKDQLGRGDIDQKHLLLKRILFSKHDVNHFYIPKGTVCLNCTKPVSPGLNILRHCLKESCNSIREHAEKIDQRCYVLHRYVWNIYTSAGVQGCTLESISKDLEGNSHLLPSHPTELLPLFQTLHDKGQVLLLRNNQNPGKSWVITDTAAVLENVIGSIFAPRDFSAHISLGSTGVVARSRIREVFPDLTTDMIIGFLEHFEFCHRVEPGWIDLSELARSPIEMTDDEFYLFPALVTSERPLHESHESSYCSGWLIRSVEHQFFTTRFLHVLLLRLAFLFSQLQDDATLSSTKTDGPAAKCKCKIWRNGISWLDKNGISSLLEVRSLKTVALSMTCLEDSRIHCVRLRSKLIQTILKSKHECCPRVLTEEFIVDVADNILLEVVNEFHSYSIKDLSRRISERCAKDNPDLMLMNSDGSQGKRISELLNFEPYALLNQDLITKLFANENAKQSVSDDFISELAQCMYPFHDALVRVLKPSSSALNKKYKDICDSLDEISKQQLMCEHIIKTWVEQQRCATYRKFRRQFNRHSIFCGRNPLNPVGESGDESGDESDDESDDDTTDSMPQNDIRTDKQTDRYFLHPSQLCGAHSSSPNLYLKQAQRCPPYALTEQDLFVLLQILKPATPKWKTLGMALGFPYDELTIIERKPMLIPEGDPGYIRDMLNQWLKWAPPNHEWPTVSALATALRNCEEENVAAKLRANFKQKKDAAGYKDRPTEVTEDSNQTFVREEVIKDSDQRDDGEVPIEHFGHDNSEDVVRATLSVNTNPELGVKFGDTNGSELLEHEQKDQAPDASSEISRTNDHTNEASSEIGGIEMSMGLIEHEKLD